MCIAVCPPEPILACARRVAWATLLLAPLVARAEITNETLLGPGLRTRPAYDGSDSQVIDVIPVIRFLGEPWFVRTTQDVLEGGYRLRLAPEVHVGAQLAYEPGRLTSESGFLQRHRVPYVDRGESVGAQLEWDHMFGPMPVALLSRVRQAADLARGARLDVRLNAGILQEGPVSAGVFAQSTWASSKSVNAFYGVTSPEVVATGLPSYEVGGGWLFGTVGFLASLDLSRAWMIVGSAESRHLYGDAAASPLTQRTSNFYASAGLAYHF